MKKLLLFLALIFAAAYAFHWYNGRVAPAPEVAPATPVAVRATPTPRHATSLQTHSLKTGGAGSTTPDPKVNPLNAPAHR
jgi:hypothetical protein